MVKVHILKFFGGVDIKTGSIKTVVKVGKTCKGDYTS